MLAAYFIIVCVFGDVGAFSLYLVIIWVLLCFSSCRTQKACMIIKKSFPLVQKFKLFGVKMGNGMWKIKIKIEILSFNHNFFFFFFPFILPLSFCVWLVECSGMMQQLRRILQMAITFVMMDGVIERRYDFCSHSFDSLSPHSLMHHLPLSSSLHL